MNTSISSQTFDISFKNVPDLTISTISFWGGGGQKINGVIPGF
jgi:hypothetical protein